MGETDCSHGWVLFCGVEDLPQAFRCRRCSYRADASSQQGKPSHSQGPAALGKVKRQAHKCRAAELESQDAEGPLFRPKRTGNLGHHFIALKKVGATGKL